MMLRVRANLQKLSSCWTKHQMSITLLNNREKSNSSFSWTTNLLLKCCAISKCAHFLPLLVLYTFPNMDRKLDSKKKSKKENFRSSNINWHTFKILQKYKSPSLGTSSRQKGRSFRFGGKTRLPFIGVHK